MKPEDAAAVAEGLSGLPSIADGPAHEAIADLPGEGGKPKEAEEAAKKAAAEAERVRKKQERADKAVGPSELS